MWFEQVDFVRQNAAADWITRWAGWASENSIAIHHVRYEKGSRCESFRISGWWFGFIHQKLAIEQVRVIMATRWLITATSEYFFYFRMDFQSTAPKFMLCSALSTSSAIDKWAFPFWTREYWECFSTLGCKVLPCSYQMHTLSESMGTYFCAAVQN